jgi:nitrite reductase/ring-hydroxylating ferredoxin subunit
MKVLPAGTPLARLTDLSDGATRGFDLTDDEWPLRGFLVRVGDAVHAYVNQCVAHGALFEKDTGLCIAGPCVDESLRRIAVRIAGGEVQLAEDVDTDRLQRGPW